MTKPAKLALALVASALLVGLVLEIGFNADDAFMIIVVAGLVSLAAGMAATIWLVDQALVRTLIERRRARFGRSS